MRKPSIIRFVYGASAFGLALLLAAHAAAATMPPKDECLARDGYFEFRHEFEAIVARRDATALIALVAPDIKWNFGGEPDTRAAFARQWKLETGKASPIWPEFERMLRLGCAPEGAGVSFPYMVSHAPEEGEFWLVTGNAVNLRAGANPASASRASLSWELVTLVPEGYGEEWSSIRTADGKAGFVKSSFLRNFLDYRAGFEMRAGVWEMTYFVAGD